MQLNTKIEYVIRALVYLADNRDHSPVNIKQICKTQKLPVKYMEQLFSKLKRKNILTSVQGPLGGYILNYPPEDLSLREIISAVEDDIAGLGCKEDKGSKEFCNGQPCFFFSNWQKIKDELDNYLDKIPLTRFMNDNNNSLEECNN